MNTEHFIEFSHNIKACFFVPNHHRSSVPFYWRRIETIKTQLLKSEEIRTKLLNRHTKHKVRGNIDVLVAMAEDILKSLSMPTPPLGSGNGGGARVSEIKDKDRLDLDIENGVMGVVAGMVRTTDAALERSREITSLGHAGIKKDDMNILVALDFDINTAWTEGTRLRLELIRSRHPELHDGPVSGADIAQRLDEEERKARTAKGKFYEKYHEIATSLVEPQRHRKSVLAALEKLENEAEDMSESGTPHLNNLRLLVENISGSNPKTGNLQEVARELIKLRDSAATSKVGSRSPFILCLTHLCESLRIFCDAAIFSWVHERKATEAAVYTEKREEIEALFKDALAEHAILFTNREAWNKKHRLREVEGTLQQSLIPSSLTPYVKRAIDNPNAAGIMIPAKDIYLLEEQARQDKLNNKKDKTKKDEEKGNKEDADPRHIRAQDAAKNKFAASLSKYAFSVEDSTDSDGDSNDGDISMKNSEFSSSTSNVDSPEVDENHRRVPLKIPFSLVEIKLKQLYRNFIKAGNRMIDFAPQHSELDSHHSIKIFLPAEPPDCFILLSREKNFACATLKESRRRVDEFERMTQTIYDYVQQNIPSLNKVAFAKFRQHVTQREKKTTKQKGPLGIESEGCEQPHKKERSRDDKGSQSETPVLPKSVKTIKRKKRKKNNEDDTHGKDRTKKHNTDKEEKGKKRKKEEK